MSRCQVCCQGKFLLCNLGLLYNNSPFSTWEKITDPTNFPDRGELHMFSTCSFYDKFTILPNLELIGTVSKNGPINPESVEPLEKAVRDGLLSNCLYFCQRGGGRGLDCKIISFKLLKHLLFHILPVFEQLET